MSGNTVPQSPLDHSALAEAVGGELHGQRLMLNGQTLAYLKTRVVTVRVAHVARAPKKFGTPHPEANGVWTGYAVKDDKAAQAILEYVAERAKAAEQKEAE